MNFRGSRRKARKPSNCRPRIARRVLQVAVMGEMKLAVEVRVEQAGRGGEPGDDLVQAPALERGVVHCLVHHREQRHQEPAIEQHCRQQPPGALCGIDQACAGSQQQQVNAEPRQPLGVRGAAQLAQRGGGQQPGWAGGGCGHGVDDTEAPRREPVARRSHAVAKRLRGLPGGGFRAYKSESAQLPAAFRWHEKGARAGGCNSGSSSVSRSR